MKKKRIIFVTTVFDKTANGPGIYAQYLWKALREDPELEFHIVAPSFGESHPQLHPIGAWRSSRELYRLVQRRARELATNQEHHTIVHGNDAYTMFDFVDYPGPWIVQVNDYEAATLWRTAPAIVFHSGWRRLLSLAWRRQKEAKVVQAATRVICNSQFTLRNVVTNYRPDTSRILTIYKAADVAAFTRPAVLPANPVPGRTPGYRLVFVGSNWARKGLDVLLRAVQILALPYPEISLVVVGLVQSSANRRIQALTERLDLSHRVSYLGLVEHTKLPRLLWHCDIFVLPSRQEALGVAILEAMAAGLPVVASDVGGISEIIRSPDEGLLVPPNNPQALAAAISALLQDRGWQQSSIRSGYRRVKSFDVASMVRSIRDLYLELD